MLILIIRAQSPMGIQYPLGYHTQIEYEITRRINSHLSTAVINESLLPTPTNTWVCTTPISIVHLQTSPET